MQFSYCNITTCQPCGRLVKAKPWGVVAWRLLCEHEERHDHLKSSDIEKYCDRYMKFRMYILYTLYKYIFKGSLVEKLPIYEQDRRVIAQSSNSSVKS